MACQYLDNIYFKRVSIWDTIFDIPKGQYNFVKSY